MPKEKEVQRARQIGVHVGGRDAITPLRQVDDHEPPDAVATDFGGHHADVRKQTGRKIGEQIVG